MARTSIWDTPEYKLAPEDKKGWAFTHPGNYASSEQAAKEMGLDLEGKSIKVKTNVGTVVDVPVAVNFHSIKPKAKSIWKNLNGKFQNFYMIKGASPVGKTSIYFTDDDVAKSDEAKALKKQIDDAFQLYHSKHHDMLKAELAKSHSALAKKAAKELVPFAGGENAAEAIYNWFAENKFDGIHSFKAKDFAGYARQIKKDGHISSSFNISSGDDGYGHQKGTDCKIDFNNRKIGAHGWSSDD